MGRKSRKRDEISSHEREQAIQNALTDVQNHKYTSVAAAARAYGLPRATLAHRHRHYTQSRVVAHRNQQSLTPAEEEALADWITRLDAQGLSPSHRAIVKMALCIWHSRNDGSIPYIGVNWVTAFLNRHPDLKTSHTRTLERKRLLATSRPVIVDWFRDYAELLRTNI